MDIPITTTMGEEDGLVRLFSWLSPAFPIGGFAYSQGLETAIAEERVHDPASLTVWLEGLLHLGPLRTDACFAALAARAVRDGDRAGFSAAAELCLALQVSAERDRETREQARSFVEAAGAWPAPARGWPGMTEGAMALPIAFGACAAAHGIAIRPAVAGFVNAALAQQISVGVRLIPLGQSAGLAVLASLEPHIARLAAEAMETGIDDVASLSHGTDIACLRHEDLPTRIFRS